MIKVVLDANQFISAILTSKGKPAHILDLIREDKIKLLISQSILEEIKRALLYPYLQKLHKLNSKQIDEKLKTISSFAKFIQEGLKIAEIKDDPDDNKYLECAVSGEADFIISGDRYLKKLKNFQGIKIIDPATFLETIKLQQD